MPRGPKSDDSVFSESRHSDESPKLVKDRRQADESGDGWVDWRWWVRVDNFNNFLVWKYPRTIEDFVHDSKTIFNIYENREYRWWKMLKLSAIKIKLNFQNFELNIEDIKNHFKFSNPFVEFFFETKNDSKVEILSFLMPFDDVFLKKISIENSFNCSKVFWFWFWAAQKGTTTQGNKMQRSIAHIASLQIIHPYSMRSASGAQQQYCSSYSMWIYCKYFSWDFC